MQYEKKKNYFYKKNKKIKSYLLYPYKKFGVFLNMKVPRNFCDTKRKNSLKKIVP